MQLSRDEYLRVSQLRPSGGVRVSSIGVIATAPAHRDYSLEPSQPTPGELQAATEAVAASGCPRGDRREPSGTH